MDHKLHNTVYARLDAIKAAEKVTKVELGHLSREALTYVMESHDIDLVNRLIGVLTPMNRRTAILFFSHFLPWEQEKNNDGVFNRFGKMLKKDKQIARRASLIEEFLANVDDNIWTWAELNIDLEVKKKDFAGTIARDIKAALKGDEKSDTPPLSIEDVIKAVMAGGVSIEDMFNAIDMPMSEAA